MKKLYSLFLLSAFCVLAASAQSWLPVGNPGFAAINQSTAVSMAIHGTTPYVAFTDSISGKADVMKYDGSNWVAVGSPGFSAGGAAFISLALDKSGTPYVAFADGANAGKETVMKFNGSSWVIVGTAGFSDIVLNWTANYNSLSLDTNGLPYVALIVKNGQCCDGNIEVWKFDGAIWSALSTSGLIYGVWEADEANQLAFIIDTANTPVLACSLGAGYTEDGWPQVFKYNGSSWTAMRTSLPAYFNWIGGLALNKQNNEPYLSLKNNGGGKFSVWNYNGSYWDSVGTQYFNPHSGFNTNTWQTTSMVIDNNNTPYVIDSTFVLKYNGSNWIQVGDAVPMGGNIPLKATLGIDNNNVTYVAFIDALNNNRVSVMKYDIFSGIANKKLQNAIGIYPNPFINFLTITGTTAKGEAILYDVMGKEMLRLKTTEGETQLNTSPLAAGAYMLSYTEGERQENVKVVNIKRY